MELDDLIKLEDKVKHLVNSLQMVRNDNIRLQNELEMLKKESTTTNQERLQIKKKVETLIELIDSIEK